jgi:hypothetical protein
MRKSKSQKPECVKCPTCGAPAVKAKQDKVVAVNLSKPLIDLVRVIRDFQCGDYSPIMDEVFDAEHAIRMAGARPEKGIDY